MRRCTVMMTCDHTFLEYYHVLSLLAHFLITIIYYYHLLSVAIIYLHLLSFAIPFNHIKSANRRCLHVHIMELAGLRKVERASARKEMGTQHFKAGRAEPSRWPCFLRSEAIGGSDLYVFCWAKRGHVYPRNYDNSLPEYFNLNGNN